MSVDLNLAVGWEYGWEVFMCERRVWKVAVVTVVPMSLVHVVAVVPVVTVV